MDTQNINTQIRDYLAHCKYEKNLNAKTLKAYATDLRQYARFAKIKGNAYCKESQQLYIIHLQNSYKIKSVKRKIASIKAFFNYLEYEEIIETNPFAKLRIKLHEPFLLPRTIPLTVVDLLLRCAYRVKATDTEETFKHKCDLRDIAVLELLYFHIFPPIRQTKNV